MPKLQFIESSLIIVFTFLMALSTNSIAGVSLDGSLGPSGAVSGPDYAIPHTSGTTAGNNLFHSFGTFSIGTNESASFSGPANIVNIIGRVTGGSPSSIDGIIRSTITEANLFLLNPAGIMFGPNASLDLTGSFHASTADYVKFSNSESFFVNPASSSVLSIADPTAFGFINTNPARVTADRTYLGLAVNEGKTLSIIGGAIDFIGDSSSPNYLLSAPGGRINLVSVASAGEVNLIDPDVSLFTRLGSINFADGGYITVEGADLYTTPGGTVTIRGGEMFFSEGGLDAKGFYGGTVDIKGESLHLNNFYVDATNYEYGGGDHPGTAFSLDLSKDFNMTNASAIVSSTNDIGRAGDISINVQGDIMLGDSTPGTGPGVSTGYYGTIQSASFWEGRGGDISIHAKNITLRNGFYINSAAMDLGDGGNITITADNTLTCTDQGNIAANAFYLGTGGTINVTANEVYLSSMNQALVTNSPSITGIAAQTDLDSNGGKIVINVANNLQILDGAHIDSILYGAGTGADIEINAKNITISGFTVDNGYTPPYFLSAVDARVLGSTATGTGGNITVSADSVALNNGGVIRTGLYDNAPFPATAGNITVNAKTIDIASRGQIYADSFRGTGNSGNITVNAANMNITGAKYVPRPDALDFDFTGLSTTTNAGTTGGTINVALTGDLSLKVAGGIKADTQGTGAGGTINLAAHNISLSDGANINASSTATGLAGNISLIAGDTLNLRGSSITTEAAEFADGGNIRISVPYRINLIDSKITSSVGGGPETTGGNINIDPEYVVMKNSQIAANAYAGTGGNISIISDTFMADPQSTVTASSQLGVSGTVDIQAPINNISGLVAPLSADYVSATALLRERCMARIREGKYSSFVVGGRDGLPIEPGNMLPGFIQ